VLVTACACGGSIVLAVLGAIAFVDVNRYKPQCEAVATRALGMDVCIGRLGLGMFPVVHMSAQDGRIVTDQGLVVASAKRVDITVAWLPLLRGQVRVGRIELVQPRLAVERDRQGRLNIEKLKRAVSLLGTLDGSRLSVADGTIDYADGGQAFEITGCTLDVHRMRFAGDAALPLPKRLSIRAEFGCGRIRTTNVILSALKGSVTGEAGVYEVGPVTMQMFGGRAVARVRADCSGDVPRYQVSYSLPDFRIEEFLRVLSPKAAADGEMDFSASVSMQGTTPGRMLQTLAGEASLRGENLVLEGADFDRNIARFKSSQNFSLVDVGAVFFAGPLGLVVTKGYNFAGLLGHSGGSSRIRTLVSDWSIDHGVARTKDVAMATLQNRIALEGRLDFVNERFDGLTMAVIDAGGCARVRQSIHGSFAAPTVDQPRVLRSLAGPMLGLYRDARSLFPARPCEAFYSGSVAPPG